MNNLTNVFSNAHFASDLVNGQDHDNHKPAVLPGLGK